MRKRLFLVAIITLPVFASAQNAQVLAKDFEKKVDFLTATCRVNDHLNIAEIAIDKDHFELVAIDEKIQAVWHSQPMNGFPLGIGNFKNKLLAVSAAEGESKHETYTAYLVDLQSGKLLLQKVIYTINSPMFVRCEASFADDGFWFRFLARETKQKETTHGLFISSDRIMQSQQITVLSLDEQLNISTTSPTVPDGYYSGFASASPENFFLAILQADGMLKAAKYETGKPAPVSIISQQVDSRESPDWDLSTMNLCASSTEKDALFFSMITKNQQKDNQLTVCRFDFRKGSSKKSIELITRRHLKDIEKSFTPPDKKLDGADLQGPDIQEVKHIADYNGTLIVTFGPKVPWQQYYTLEGSYVINGYDHDMNLKFQQVMPSMVVYSAVSYPQASYYNLGDKMYMTANYGNMKYYTIYGQLDLNTGKWLKLQRLEKDKLDKTDFVTPNNLWYKDNFVLFYIPFKNGLNSKLNFSLQSNPY